jgi:probable phosphoglycerate mutase
MRHGEGAANAQSLIVSNPKRGILDEWGLTEIGEGQVRDRANGARIMHLLEPNPIILSSPFSRCVATAKIVRTVLGLKDQIVIDHRLCERDFGELEGKDTSHYQAVWDRDVSDPFICPFGNESAHQVLVRMWDLVRYHESTYRNQTFLLVSHDDPLRILITAFHRNAAKEAVSWAGLHRSIKEFRFAEIRQLHIF